MELLTGYLLGFASPFALYGLYKYHQWFTHPSDYKAVLSRLEYEQERIIQEGAQRTINCRN